MSFDPGESPPVIRSATREEFPLLQAVERDASRRFHELPDLIEIPDDVTPIEELEQALLHDLVWVAEIDGTIAGYAYAARLDPYLHLEEISVSPRFGRRGLGRTLVTAVIDRARHEGLAGVTLTTFRDVPWNAPFYSRMGFRILQDAELTSEIRDAIEHEEQRGLPAHLRVAMIHSLQDAGS